MNPRRLAALWGAQLPPKSAWLSAIAAILINISGMVLYPLTAGPASDSIPMWPLQLSAAVGAVLLLFLVLRRRSITTNIAAAAYMANAAAVIVALSLEHDVQALLGSHWVPFQASKLGCMIAAMLAPSFTAGLGVVAAHAAVPIIQYWTFSEQIRSQLAFGEPWAMAAFAFAGFVILTLRFGQILMERKFEAAAAEATTVKEFASTMLKFRDMMNTPLQTLDLGINVLSDEHAKADTEVLARMKRAVYSLRDINGLLTKYEKSLDWDAAPPYDQRL